MVKIIGRDEAVVKRITCKSCGSILEYTPSEVITLWSGTDISGGSDGGEGFKCPSCNNKVVTRSW